MTILTVITIFLIFSSISPPAKIIEIEKEVIVHDTIIEYRSVYDWQKEKRYAIRSEQVVRNMDIVANQILTPIQIFADRYRGKPTRINVLSFCRDWNKGSDHTKGLAADIDIDVMYSDFGNREIFEFIRDNLVFSQLIVYNSLKKPTHIHVSYEEGNNKQEVYLGIERRRKQTWYKRIK